MGNNESQPQQGQSQQQQQQQQRSPQQQYRQQQPQQNNGHPQQNNQQQQQQQQMSPEQIALMEQQQQQVRNAIYSNQVLENYNPNDYYSVIYGARASQKNIVHSAAQIENMKSIAVKNDISIDKSSIKLIRNDKNKKLHHLTFKFTFEVEAGVSIYYAAVEHINQQNGLIFVLETQVPEYNPNRHYKFQPCKNFEYPVELYPLDVSQFAQDQLFRHSQNCYPLIIKVEKIDQSVENKAIYTYCTFKKGENGNIDVQVLKQRLEINGVAYTMAEAFGINDSSMAIGGDLAEGKDCTICMTDKTDTLILPCNHMCLCFDCCLDLRQKSNKCPICRTVIKKFVKLTKTQIQEQQQQQGHELLSNFPMQDSQHLQEQGQSQANQNSKQGNMDYLNSFPQQEEQHYQNPLNIQPLEQQQTTKK